MVSGGGTHTVEFFSTDDVGVFEPVKSVTFEIKSLQIITDSPLPSGTVGQPYSTTFEATGGTGPYTWSVDSGSLPPGLSLDAQSGEISGSPTAAGTFGFTIRVTDSSQVTKTKQFALSPPPSGGEAGTDYPPTPIVITPPPDGGDDGGTPPCSNYVLAQGSDPLPPGMSLDPVTGILSGTPENGGTYSFIVQCTFNASQTATKDFTITINNPGPSLTALDPDSIVEESGGFTLTLTGTDFVHDSVARLNGSPRPTSYVSAKELQVSIDTSDIETPGTATLTVFNPAPGGGESNALTLTIESKNLPPTVDSGGPYTVDEGGAVTLTAAGSDPDVGDTLTYAWDFDGDGVFETPGQGVTFSSATIDGPTTRNVAVQVTDSGGLTATAEALVTIDNVGPTITELSNTGPIEEGSKALIQASVFDPAGFEDRLVYEYDCDNDGVYEINPSTSYPVGTAAIVHVTLTPDGFEPATIVVESNTIVIWLNQTGEVQSVNSNPHPTNHYFPILNQGLFPDGFSVQAWLQEPGVYTYHNHLKPDQTGEIIVVPSCHFDDDGTHQVNVRVTDDDGAVATGQTFVSVTNVAPTATFGATSPIIEGGSSPLTLTDAHDASSADEQAGFRYALTCDGLDASLPTTYAAANITASATCPFADDGTYLVEGRIFDDDDSYRTYEATVVVENADPVVGPISAPLDPRQAGTVIDVSAPFTDAGTADTHTAEWDWGDGTTSAGTVAEADGSGTGSGMHSYAAPGVYVVRVSVHDDDGGEGTAIFEYVVVYNPSGGFVTGGGWIESPAGAYPADPALVGKANFGFVAKYKKGANVPTGNTEFQFKAGDLNFKSTSYQWLVVAGAKAQFKGYGTINGAGEYGFMLTAIDGQVNGGGGVDKFRIKIWELATGTIVYDNKLDASDTDDASTGLGGGSIVVHK